MQKILCWRHTGFNVHSQVRAQAKSEEEPSCGGRMRIISFIDEPKTIDRIIRYLELTFEAEQPPPLHHVQQELLIAAKGSGEYF